MEIKRMNDLYNYIGFKIGRKISESEKAQIRMRAILGKTVQEILTELEIDYSDAVIH